MNRVLRFCVAFGIVLTCLQPKAQLKIVKVNFYFDSGKSIPEAASLARMDSLIALLKNYDVPKISLSGYSDSIGDSILNLRLSAKRTDSIYNTLLSKGVNPKIVKLEYYGEKMPQYDNSLEEGRSKNRRVSLVALYQAGEDNKDDGPVDEFVIGRKKAAKVEKARPSANTIPPRDFVISPDGLIEPDPAPPCKRIQITLPQGTILSICETDYYLFKDCMKTTELYKPDSSLNAALKKGKKKVDPVLVQGLSMELCDDKCATEDIEVLMPVHKKLKVKSPQLMVLNKGFVWEKARHSRKVQRGDTLYYEWQTKCGGLIACGTNGLRPAYPVKFKNRTGQQLDSVYVLLNFAAYNIAFSNKQNPKRFMGKLPVLFTEPMVRIVVKTDSITEQISIPLGKLKGKKVFKEFRDMDTDLASVFALRKKYVIRKKDLTGGLNMPVGGVLSAGK